MTRILSFDSSAEACTAALLNDGQIFVREEFTARSHAQYLLPFIESLLDEQRLQLSDLDVITFGCGPGSFTGLRIAAGVAQGLSFGSGCPVLPVSNLRAMALKASRESGQSRVLSAFDARMDEVYWGLFDIVRDPSSGIPASVELVDKERVSKPEQVTVSSVPAFGIGSGFEFYGRFPEATRELVTAYEDSARPHAVDVLELARLDLAKGVAVHPAEFAKPTYVRDEVAWKKLPGR